MRNASPSRLNDILTWLAVVAMALLCLLLFAMPAPASVEAPKAPAAESNKPSTAAIEGIDVDYLPARFYEEQKRAQMQEPAPTF
jgi:hypothetical protein